MQEPPIDSGLTERAHNRIVPKRTGLLILGLVALLVAALAGVWFWQQQNSPQAQNLGAQFSNARGRTAVPVGDCTANQQIAMGTTSTITMGGHTKIVDKTYCRMTLTTQGKRGSATFNCTYPLEDQPEIFLATDESGSDETFIRQFCTFKE